MRITAPILLILLILSACTGTGPERAPGEAFATETVALDVPEGAAYTPTLDGPLRLLSASPQGTLDAWREGQGVAVTFTRPMVPLGETLPVPEGQITLQPEVPGTLRWEGTQTLVFTPEEPLPVATAFEATLHPGLTAVDGSTWDERYRWTFETPRPQLVRSQPRDGEHFVEPAASVWLDFNQAVDAGEAERYVHLWADGDRKAYRLRNDGDSTLVLMPNSVLPRGAPIDIVLLAGLPSAAGDLGMKEQHTVRFDTYGPLLMQRVTQHGHRRDDRPFHPSRGVTLEFTTPVAFGELRRSVTLEPAVEWPEGIEARDAVESTSHALPLDLEPETKYRLSIDSLTDRFGQMLRHAGRTFRTSAFEPSLYMPRGLLVIEADEQRAVPLRVTNVSEVHAGLRRLAPAEVVPLLADYGPHFYGRRSQATDSVALDRTIPLDVPRNQPTTVPLQLDSLLSPGGTGTVAVRLQRGANREYRALAVVTRLGVTAKFSPHQNLVFATDLQTAEPVAQARVTIRSDSNRVLWRGRTDAQGRAVTPGWAELGLEQPDHWSQPVQYAFVETDGEDGGDFAFTSSAYDDGIEPYRFDVSYDWSPEPERFAGSVFTDRGLYRAGDSVFVKAILRRRTDGDWQSVRDSVRLLVTDPRDRLVHDARFLPSELGTFDFAWQAPPSAAQGRYDVRVVSTTDTAALERSPWAPGDLARGTFRVDAFRRATFAVTARASADSYVAGDFFEGSIEGRYLFGATMQDQPVTYVLTRQNGHYEPPGYPGYRFGSYESISLHQELARADTVLREDGTVDVRVPLPGNSAGRVAEVRWTGRVTDPARQEIAATETYTLHPGLFYLGLKPQTTFLDLSDHGEIGVHVVTVDPEGQPVAARDVEVTLVRQQWHSVREVGADGRPRWRSERVEEVKGRQTIRTERGRATRLVLPVEEGGRYVVRAEGRDVRGNAVRTDTYFYATGRGYVAWQRTDDDRIELQADATLYRPGETARIMVPSPYEEATALITVEREGILLSRVEHLTGSAPQIEVPIDEAYLPNVFVSVILLNGRTAEPGPPGDPGAPSFKIGYTELRVSPERRHLTVEVEPDRQQYRPGDEVTAALRLRDQRGDGVPGEIAFSAADAGVLDLLGYALPDPFDTFYGPRPLGVRTSESLAHLVKQRDFGQKSEDLGGGGGEDSDALMREDFRPSAHWEPALRTDRRGRATVTFRLPESLTTFRLMATALTADHRFGQGQADVVVTQPLVMQPALPRFARPGDTFEAGVLVTNTTGAPGAVTVTAEADELVLVGERQQTHRLADGATQEVRFRWRADATGTSRLTFRAELGSERDALTTTLPVALPSVKHVSATFASTEGAAQEALQVPSDRVPGLGSLQVRLSSTALVGLDGAAQYLFDYPYGCLEQRTSRVRPLLLADALLEAFDLSALNGDRDRVVQAWLRDLDDFWTGGGFAMWAGSDHAYPYVSAYTVLALAEARDAGYAVPADLTGQAVDALTHSVRRRSDRPDYYDSGAWNDTRALMLYALARHGRTLASEIDALAKDASSMSVEGASLLLRAVDHADEPSLERHRTPLLQRLRQRVRVEATRAYLAAADGPAYRWIFASDTRATAHGLAALAEVDPSTDTQQLTERMVRYLMDTRRGGHWSSTQDNAVVIDAFRAYFEAFEDAAPDFAATVRLAGRDLLDATFRGRSLDVAEETMPAADLRVGERLPVTVEKTGTGRAYYALRLETYSTEARAAAEHGLVVERTLQRLDDRGEPTGEAMRVGRDDVALEPGRLVRVTLRLAAPTDRHYVAVDDALPAGLETVNAAFATVDQSVLREAGAGQDSWWGSFNHTEMRDDRVLLFADLLRRGSHTYTYVARATTPGTFRYPAAQAEEMYSPETRGHTADGTLVVRAEAGS